MARSTCSPSRQQKRNHNSRNQLKSDGANTNTRRTIKSRSKVCKSGTANLSNDSSGRDTHTNSVQYDANERDDYQRKADMQMQKFGRRVDFDLLEATKRLAATHCNDEPTNIENKVRAFKLRSRIRAERVQKRNDAHRVRAMNEWIGHLVDRDIKMKKTIAEVKTTKKEQPQSKMLITQPFSPSSSSLVSLPLHLSSPLQPSVSRLRPPPSSPSSSLSSSLEETTKKKSKNRAIKKKRDGQDYNTGIAILSPPSSFPPRSPFHRTGRDMARESLHSQYQEQLLQQTLRRFPINARVQVHERKGSVMYVGFLRACGEGIWVVIDLDVPHTMHQYLPLIESDSMCLPIHRDNLCELQELAECIDLCTGHTNIIGEKENEEVNCDVGNHTHGNEKGLHTLPYEQDDKNNTNDDNKTTRMTKEDRKGAGDDNLRAKFRRMLISRVKYVKYADTYRHTSTHDEGGSARNINERADKYSYNQSNNNQTRQNMPISSDTECSVTSRLIKHCILIQRWFRHCLIVRAHARVRAHRYAYLEEYTAVDEHALRTPLPTIPTSSSSLSASSLVSNWTTHSHNHNFTQSHEVYQSHEQYHEHQTHNDYNRYGNLHAHTGNKDYCHTQSRSSLVEHELYESVISALSEFLTSALDIDTPMKKVRAIFTYLCHRISVDADPSLFTEATLSSSSPSSLSSTTATAFLPSSFGSRAPVYMHQKILHILRTGVADSEGMADIFCALVQACGFLCYKVEGVCKLDKDHIDAVYAHSNHYWNIVLVGK